MIWGKMRKSSYFAEIARIWPSMLFLSFLAIQRVSLRFTGSLTSRRQGRIKPAYRRTPQFLCFGLQVP